MVDLTSVWPSWGSTGSQPSDGTDHSPGDNPKAQTYNHLWHHIKDTFSTIETWINDRETAITVSNKDATVKGLLTLEGDLSDGTNTVYDRSNGYVPQSRLENDMVTVAGNSVSLGGSVGVDHADLSNVSVDQHHSKDHDHSEAGISTVPNSGLTNDSVTVAGNSVSLGSSVGVDHADLNSVGENQHHPKDHDHSEADISLVPNNGLANNSVTVAGNSVALGNSTSINHSDLSGIGSADHHAKYTDSEAVSAVNAENSLTVDISGDADTVDGKDASDLESNANETSIRTLN